MIQAVCTTHWVENDSGKEISRLYKPWCQFLKETMHVIDDFILFLFLIEKVFFIKYIHAFSLPQLPSDRPYTLTHPTLCPSFLSFLKKEMYTQKWKTKYISKITIKWNSSKQSNMRQKYHWVCVEWLLLDMGPTLKCVRLHWRKRICPL